MKGGIVGSSINSSLSRLVNWLLWLICKIFFCYKKNASAFYILTKFMRLVFFFQNLQVKLFFFQRYKSSYILAKKLVVHRILFSSIKSNFFDAVLDDLWDLRRWNTEIIIILYLLFIIQIFFGLNIYFFRSLFIMGLRKFVTVTKFTISYSLS